MKIVINDYLGHAAPVQLSRALAARGHSVLHLYSGAAQTPKADLVRHADDPPGFDVRAIGGDSAGQAGGEHPRSYGRGLAQAVLDFAPDVVLAGNNPLPAQQALQSACRSASIRFVYWLRQLYAFETDAAVADKPLLVQMAAESHARWLEGKLLRQSDAIIPVAEYELALLEEVWDIPARQAMVVRDWAPLDAVTPQPKDNAWARSQGIADRKTVLYSGTLDWQHDPALIVRTATELRDREDVLMLVVSGGAGADMVQAAAREHNLTNLQVLPFQPYERYPEVLASADVLFAMAGNQLFFVPSKINAYLCAARPIVLCAGRSNLAADVVQHSGGGVVQDPADGAGIRKAILHFIDDPQDARTVGARGRAYAERSFAISPIADRFERLFERLRAGPPRATGWSARLSRAARSWRRGAAFAATETRYDSRP